MNPFTFYHNGKTENAFVEHFYEEGYNRFRIALPDLFLVIAPAGIRGVADRILWVQCVSKDELVQPHDFIQTIGEGLEQGGFYS
jgi:hypothetical protein